MDSDYLTSASTALDLIPKLTAMIAASYIIWLLIKTESLYLLKARLLELLGGKREINNPKIKKILEEHAELHHFNWHLGLNVRSTREMYRLLAWAKRHGLDVSTLSKARPYLNVNTLTVKSWGINKVVAIGCVFGAIYVTSLTAGLFLAVVPATPLQITKTGTRFWASHDSTYGIWGNWKIQKTDCYEHTIPTEELDDWDKKALCKFLENPDLQLLEHEKKETKKVAVWVIFINLGAVILFIFKIGKVAEAKRIQRLVQSGKKSMRH